MKSHVLLLFFLTLCLSLYEGNSPVKSLTDQSFPKLLKSKSMYLVQFYSPSCGHCVQAAPEYQKAAAITEGVITFAAIDMTKYGSLGAKYGIKGYPTFKFFGGDKENPVDYRGGREAKEFVQFGLTETKKVIEERANGGKGKSGKGEGNTESGSSSKKGKVIELTQSIFKQKVLTSQDAFFIEFYSPSCGHCKTLQPQFAKLPSLMKGKVRIAKVDATVHRALAQQYQIQGYPTLIFFPKGKKDKTEKYQGQRSAEDMATWLNTQKIGPVKVELLQLSKTSYNTECQKNYACVVILVQNDTQLKNIKFLKQSMQKSSQSPIKYFFTKEKLEILQSDLMIDDRSYPKVVGIYPSRNSFKVFNKQLQQSQFQKYLNEMFVTNWFKFNGKIENYLFPDSQL